MARAKGSTLVNFDEEQSHEFLNRTIREAGKAVFEALTYYQFPEAHWTRIRTKNPPERL